MDNYSIHNFYNNHRTPLKPTTLHDGNLPKSSYKDVMYIRNLMCKENLYDNKRDRFNVRGHDKENKKT